MNDYVSLCVCLASNSTALSAATHRSPLCIHWVLPGYYGRAPARHTTHVSTIGEADGGTGEEEGLRESKQASSEMAWLRARVVELGGRVVADPRLVDAWPEQGGVGNYPTDVITLPAGQRSSSVTASQPEPQPLRNPRIYTLPRDL